MCRRTRIFRTGERSFHTLLCLNTRTALFRRPDTPTYAQTRAYSAAFGFGEPLSEPRYTCIVWTHPWLTQVVVPFPFSKRRSKKELSAAHKKSPGGMRRVDSLELHRLRLPEIVRKTKGPSSLGKRKAPAQRANTMTASLLSFMGLGGGTNTVVKA